MTTVLWALLGLWFTGKLLRLFFSENITATTLCLLAFGTNIYTYASGNTGLSHLLVFFQFALFLWWCARWLQHYRPVYLYGMAVLLGWITITRPPDALIFLVPLLWGINKMRSEADVILLLRKNLKHLLLAACCFILVMFPQFLYWKYVTGHFIFFSYEHEGFHFNDPHIIDGLFSYYRGWFIYTPLAFIALAGFFLLPEPLQKARAAMLLYLCAIVYVVFSWYQWHYGWSFGCRALLESLVIISLPLAALVNYISTKAKSLKVTAAGLGILLVALNIFQSHQFSSNTLPDGITRAYYWRVFLRMEATEDDRKLLRPQVFKY